MKYRIKKNQHGCTTQFIILLSENIFSDSFIATLKRFIIAELIQKRQRVPITLQDHAVQIQMTPSSMGVISICICVIDTIVEERIISLDAFVDYCKYLRQTYPELQRQEKTVVQHVSYFLQLYQSTLSSMQSVDTTLFYAVNAANIVKIAYAKNKTAVAFHDLGTTVLAIGFVIWRLFQWNLSLLGQLLFIALFQWIITKASNKIQNGFLNSIFSFSNQLLLSTIFLSYSAYQSLSSGEPISQTIAAPRYGLNLIAQLIPEPFRILIRMACINAFSFGMKNCLDKKTFEVPAYQSGSASIAILSVHFLMPFTDPYLFQLRGWENAHLAEEKLLLFFSKACKQDEHCELLIKESVVARMRQYFLPTQTLSVTMKNNNAITECTAKILPANNYITECVSRFFQPTLREQGLLPTTDRATKIYFKNEFTL